MKFFEIYSTLQYLCRMYQCREQPFKHPHSKRVFRAAYAFLKKWKEETGVVPPSVLVKAFTPPEQVLLNWFRSHTEKNAEPDKERRYRLLPCVRELLENTTAPPTPRGCDNFALDGLSPDGTSFKVILRRDRQNRLHLLGCFPRKP
jgi:hypothetical protein